MGSKAPSWADQWSTGSFSGEDDDMFVAEGNSNSNTGKKLAEVKSAVSAGFDKAKTAAAIGAQKVNSRTSMGIKWIKNQYQKKISK